MGESRALKAVGTRAGKGRDVGSCPQCFSLLVRAFRVSKDPDGKVFDVRRPLRRQLEKLHIVPLDAVDQYCRGGETNITSPQSTFTRVLY